MVHGSTHRDCHSLDYRHLYERWFVRTFERRVARKVVVALCINRLFFLQPKQKPHAIASVRKINQFSPLNSTCFVVFTRDHFISTSYKNRSINQYMSIYVLQINTGKVVVNIGNKDKQIITEIHTPHLFKVACRKYYQLISQHPVLSLSLVMI